jgi:two-component system, chemotaxis family, response regulator Rcp1
MVVVYPIVLYAFIQHERSLPIGSELTLARGCEGVYEDAPIPDIVFLDLGMPRVDGFQVLAEMKAQPELRRISVIIMSSSDAKSDLARAYDAQIVAYLVKPIDLDSYFSAIRAIKEFWFNVVTLAPKARKVSG